MQHQRSTSPSRREPESSLAVLKHKEFAMTRSRFSKPPVRPRYHGRAAKLQQRRRLGEESPEDGLEDWMAASGDSSSAR
jgi:hypothetical protein